jgi:hypothetical protein
VLTQPLWVVKTRFLLLQEHTNSLRILLKLLREDGFRGLGKGLGLSLLLSFNGSLLVVTYELFKRMLAGTPSVYFLAGGLSKLACSLILYPISTVRTRIQQDQRVDNANRQFIKYSSVRDVIVRIVREESLVGFYKGCGIYLSKNVLQKGLYFHCYETAMAALGHSSSASKV